MNSEYYRTRHLVVIGKLVRGVWANQPQAQCITKEVTSLKNLMQITHVSYLVTRSTAAALV